MVLIFAETWNGTFKKSTLEAVQYGAACAKSLGTHAAAVVFGATTEDLAALGGHGAQRVIHVTGAASFEPLAYGQILAAVAREENAQLVVVSGTTNGKSLTPLVSAALDAPAVTNVLALPHSFSPLTVRRGAFSSKGLEDAVAHGSTTVLCIVPNAIGMAPAGTDSASIAPHSATATGKTQLVEQQIASGKIPLPEAERVVSAGRGMKGPENWNLIEALAQELNAGTACSKPVSDIGWRPHSEHVGQTGIQINPQLYIAVGISGAIQHLAGVSSSKTIVVINSDPEAPFFKAADYGVVGDAFDVVPKLTEALRAFHA
jgi:electron transfer flavoprotein alpha subunit